MHRCLVATWPKLQQVWAWHTERQWGASISPPEQKALVIEVMKLTEPWKPGTCRNGINARTSWEKQVSEHDHLLLDAFVHMGRSWRLCRSNSSNGPSHQLPSHMGTHWQMCAAHPKQAGHGGAGAHPVVFSHLSPGV